MSKLNNFSKVFEFFLWSIAVVLVVMNVASSLRGLWLCDLCSQFRLLYLFIAMPLTALALVARRYKVSIILFGILAYNTFQIFTPLLPLRASNAEQSLERISLLEYNTEFQHNRNWQAFTRQYGSSTPDVLVLVEVDKAWIDALSSSYELNQALPYKKNAIDGPGLALWSRYPIKSVEVRHFGKTHHPRILATLDCGNRELHILVAHPTTPQSEAGYKERNEELALIGKELAAQKQPTLLIGDLNCGPWSA